MPALNCSFAQCGCITAAEAIQIFTSSFPSETLSGERDCALSLTTLTVYQSNLDHIQTDGYFETKLTIMPSVYRLAL